MIIIYHDVGGTHSTAVAANIHINNLPIDKVPDKNEILSLPTFDKIQKSQLGHLLYIGEDEFGFKVYTLGRKYKPNFVIPAMVDSFNIAGIKAEELYIVDTHPAVNIWMKIGGFSSRRLNLVTFGRPIVTYGTLKTYKNIAAIVRGVKETIKKGRVTKKN
ncbi:DUF3189 family protein [Clostridium magnum]|uniref:DUF3189 family protein n=1 Tax=Clostridium magnum DSM 2767 TaxID=1121326 RepID=A0A161YRC1_9CLOT|nr:DUF3189 family protein [Clostridium magnum]KZL93482.1 hypothetical protein CLMAG_05280 [Clostridium magnum DSM 2767]SHI27446.1 Protein of unknown function [Clostridium magnum DSM 2767]